MAEHPNVARTRQALQAFGAGNLDVVRDFLGDDVVWHTPGNNPMSGTVKGRDEALGVMGRTASETGGTFRAEVHDIVGNDEHVVALMHVTGERNGKRLDQNVINVFHVDSAGKATERWLFTEEQAAIDDFWS